MTKTMTIHKIPARRTQGFTLIEMLVVAALIAIFAGLAVFNIVEQLNREKEKAAIAEARSIATAMSFAYDDMGFYPKLCFLRFGVDELKQLIIDNSLPNDSIDWFDRGGTTMANMISKNWGDKYMSGSMPDKYVRMTVNFRSGSTQDFKWPADPWMQPYMAYLVKMDLPAGQTTGQKSPMWANETLGDKASYFAGIVSYGRNMVPGYVWNDPNAVANGAVHRLYVQDGADKRHFTTGIPVYNQANLDWFVLPETNPSDTAPPWANPPHMRDALSDDKYFEF